MCYYFDKAVWSFGSSLQAALNEAEDTGGKKVSATAIQQRKQAVLDQWIPPRGGETSKRFKDPAVGAFSKPRKE